MTRRLASEIADTRASEHPSHQIASKRRRERDKAKDLLKEGKDPSTEKQLDKHRQAAGRTFGQWCDEWLAKKKVEKVKRGRIVAVRDPKTIEVLELRVGYVKTRFGKMCRQDIKRPDVLAFMRSYDLPCASMR